MRLASTGGVLILLSAATAGGFLNHPYPQPKPRPVYDSDGIARANVGLFGFDALGLNSVTPLLQRPVNALIYDEDLKAGTTKTQNLNLIQARAELFNAIAHYFSVPAANLTRSNVIIIGLDSGDATGNQHLVESALDQIGISELRKARIPIIIAAPFTEEAIKILRTKLGYHQIYSVDDLSRNIKAKAYYRYNISQAVPESLRIVNGTTVEPCEGLTKAQKHALITAANQPDPVGYARGAAVNQLVTYFIQPWIDALARGTKY